MAGVSTQTIRFYERRGLLSRPQREGNGYREHDTSVLPRLAFIRSGQAAGLTLVEIASILDLRRDGTVPCAHVHTLLLTKREDLQRRKREIAGRLTPHPRAGVETSPPRALAQRARTRVRPRSLARRGACFVCLNTECARRDSNPKPSDP